MVKNIPVDFTDDFGHTNVAEIACDSGTISYGLNPYSEFTHKRVVISGYWPDTLGETFSIGISPVRALLLAKRLMQVLDGLAREGVALPPLYSRFMDAYDQVVDLDRMPAEFRDFCSEIQSSTAVRDGELLGDALPPALT